MGTYEEYVAAGGTLSKAEWESQNSQGAKEVAVEPANAAPSSPAPAFNSAGQSGSASAKVTTETRTTTPGAAQELDVDLSAYDPISPGDAAANFSDMLKNWKSADVRKFEDVVAQYKDQIGNPITAAIKAAQPEFNAQKAERLKKVAAINSVGDAFKALFSGVVGRQGGPIPKLDTKTTFAALKDYQDMIDKDEKYSYQTKLAEAQQLSQTLGMATQSHEAEKARAAQDDLAKKQYEYDSAVKLMENDYRYKYANAQSAQERTKLQVEYNLALKKMANELNIAKTTASAYAAYNQARAAGIGYDNQEKASRWDGDRAVSVETANGTITIPQDQMTAALQYHYNKSRENVLQGKNGPVDLTKIMPGEEIPGPATSWAKNKTLPYGDVQGFVQNNSHLFERDASGFYKFKYINDVPSAIPGSAPTAQPAAPNALNPGEYIIGNSVYSADSTYLRPLK